MITHSMQNASNKYIEPFWGYKWYIFLSMKHKNICMKQNDNLKDIKEIWKLEDSLYVQ